MSGGRSSRAFDSTGPTYSYLKSSTGAERDQRNGLPSLTSSSRGPKRGKKEDKCYGTAIKAPRARALCGARGDETRLVDKTEAPDSCANPPSNISNVILIAILHNAIRLHLHRYRIV